MFREQLRLIDDQPSAEEDADVQADCRVGTSVEPSNSQEHLRGGTRLGTIIRIRLSPIANFASLKFLLIYHMIFDCRFTSGAVVRHE
jgi:hypothetical protein